MSIRIQRNENGNCINFVGSSQPAYWNACLEGEVNETDANRVNVLNTVRTTDSDSPVYEFFAVPYTEFRTALGTAFNSAQECADYITAQANATAIGIIEFGANDVVDFQRDATNTTILASTGQSYPVNSIKAVAQADGTITIKENVDDGTDLMRFVRSNNVTFGGQTQAQQLTPVVNALNSLFTVTPVGTGAEDRFVSNTYTSGTPAITTFGDVTINANVATKGTNTSSEFNDGFFTSSAPISQNGEYFQFDNSGNDPLKKMMIGLMLTSEVSVAALEDNTLTGEDMDLAVRLKPNATYEHSPYGAVIENGMFTNPQRSDEYRAGIDNDGRLFISHYNDDASEWQVIVRSALVTAADEEYSLVVFLKQENAACSTLVTCKEIYDGPVMTYYYIESPDGSFYYPLFATEEEANQLDTDNGGSGTNHTHTFADETPTSQLWYMPTTGGTHAGSSAPSNTADITYNVIATGADANYAPAAFTISDLTVNENTSVNYQVSPAGATWTTTVSGLPLNLSLSGNNIVGTTPEVTGDTTTNPSDTSTVSVTRTNSFGSTTSTFDIIINNTTAPAPTVSGWTHIAGSTAMVDSNTLAAGSAMDFVDVTEAGKRVVLTNSWINTNVFDAMGSPGSSNGAVYIGFQQTGQNWNATGAHHIKFGFRFYKEVVNGVHYKYASYIVNGSVVQNISYSTNFNRDVVLFHDYAGSGKLHGTPLATSGTGATMVTPTNPTRFVTATSADEQVVMFTGVTTCDVADTGSGEYTSPVVNNIVTDWTKALDFSGSSEHLKQVSSSMYAQPLQMNGLANTVDLGTRSQGETSNNTSSRPWATAVVFKSDGHSGNQMIWNQGEGSSSGNDNIYLRLTAVGSLIFGWGREGTGYNECRIANQSISSSNWYGVYVAHSGVRLGGNAATAANLADCFDIRLMSSADSFGSLGNNLSTSANWTSTGYRMDRTVAGDFTIGGRGSGYGFRGKVASMITTTLISEGNFTHSTPYSQQPGGLMYNDAQIELMITDPVKWVADYKVRHGIYNTSAPFRNPAERFTIMPFLIGSQTNAPRATQVWLMGDGASDSYANGVRNYINPADQNYVKLQLNSMVSNDIETVNIPGLT